MKNLTVAQMIEELKKMPQDALVVVSGEDSSWGICQAVHTDEKLQEQLNTAKKYIEHVIGTIKHDGHLGTIQTDWILPYLEKVLVAIGGDDE